MEDSPLVSIVIPAYNAEKYLDECLRSIVGQTYANIEVLIVDDGSTDSTMAIGRKWILRDKRVRYIRTVNSGVSAARNVGIDSASGEWIGFVDADDCIDPQFVSVLIGNALSYDAEISSSTFGLYRKFECRKSVKLAANKVLILSAQDAMADVLYQKRIDNSPWDKLYRTDLWRDLRFRTGSRYEDLDAFYRVFARARRIVFTPLAMYHYRQHSESYMHRFDASHTIVLDVTSRIVEYMAENYPSLLPAAYDRELSANFNIFVRMHANGAVDRATADRCWKRIRELRRGSLFNRHVRLKNKVGIIASYIGGRPLIRLLSYMY